MKPKNRPSAETRAKQSAGMKRYQAKRKKELQRQAKLKKLLIFSTITTGAIAGATLPIAIIYDNQRKEYKEANKDLRDQIKNKDGAIKELQDTNKSLIKQRNTQKARADKLQETNEKLTGDVLFERNKNKDLTQKIAKLIKQIEQLSVALRDNAAINSKIINEWMRKIHTERKHNKEKSKLLTAFSQLAEIITSNAKIAEILHTDYLTAANKTNARNFYGLLKSLLQTAKAKEIMRHVQDPSKSNINNSKLKNLIIDLGELDPEIGKMFKPFHTSKGGKQEILTNTINRIKAKYVQ